MSRPTIHDVAQRAGVSKSLVALVFKSGEKVSDLRREKVLKAAAELGYTPNAWASALRSGNNGFVGIIVADFHNPLFTEIADLARKALAAKGVFSFVSAASLIESGEERTLDPKPISHLLDLKPSSLLIVGGLPELSAFKTVRENLPIVVALAPIGDLTSAVSVRSDDNQAMSLVLDHLKSLGHKNVAYIGPDDRLVSQVRKDAFLAKAQVLELDTVVVSTGSGLDEASGQAAATNILREANSPTALVCYNDNVAFGAQSALLRSGVTGVAVTGYDNTYISQLDLIALTSIEQNEARIAEVACELLTNSEEYEKAQGTEFLVEPQLVVRKSSSLT